MSQICNAASTHKIMMNQVFVSIALTVRVMEGVAFALNPTAEVCLANCEQDHNASEVAREPSQEI